MMKYVIATTSEAKLNEWRLGLAGLECVQFRVGFGADTVGNADAAVVPFQIAHDRYGGTPQVGHSQVLNNGRRDGYPKLIVSTPPFSAGERVDDQKVLADRLFFTIATCFMAVQVHNANNPGERIDLLFLHVDGMGFDRFPANIVIEAFRRAVIAHDAVAEGA